ncbi:DNA-(Apurinic or apyrimidinic site) lyase / pyrimidine dimer DNA glycosylase [Burkholderiales bacterium]|nr:DNA-(Apurinic or apyrimidinic site) lyase / pyrimidine dimer DNA glycosylase [Burkholderiales bacterium]
MRIGTLHPKYLDVQGLVALWREALLAQKGLRGRTVGYRAHPQLRFRARCAPVVFVASYLQLVHEEAQRRGYHFDATRIARTRVSGSLTESIWPAALHEWQHLLGKLQKRSPERFAQFRDVVRPEAHLMFRIVAGGVRDWERMPAGRKKA